MAITNHERVGKALDLLKDGLQPFVEREMKAQHAQLWLEQVQSAVADTQTHLFSGKAERTLVSELRDFRNRWAHQKPFTGDDAYRALDSTSRLLAAVSAPQAEEV